MAKGGFGMVYQSIMRDPNLSAEAKAVYAYLSSIAGAKGTCYPSIELMQHELNLGKNRLTKYMNQLVEAGVVVKKRERRGNLWGRNIYKINHTCEADIRSIENRAVGNETVGFRSVERGTDNIISSTNKNFKINPVDYYKEKEHDGERTSTGNRLF